MTTVMPVDAIGKRTRTVWGLKPRQMPPSDVGRQARVLRQNLKSLAPEIGADLVGYESQAVRISFPTETDLPNDTLGNVIGLLKSTPFLVVKKPGSIDSPHLVTSLD